jgi:hypothetical protein
MAAKGGMSTGEGLSLAFSAVGTIATVIFVYQQSQAANAAANAAKAANTQSQAASSRTINMIRRINLPASDAGAGLGRTGLGW